MNFKDETITNIATLLKLPKEHVLNMANGEDSYSFNNLKVDQLKNIIKYYKSIGFHQLSVYVNKPALVDTVQNLLNGKYEKTSSNSTQFQNSSSNGYENTFVHKSTAQHNHFQQHHVNSLIHPTHNIMGVGHNNYSFHQHYNPSNNYSVQQQQQQQLHSEINTPGKRQAYLELMAQPGLTQKEVLDELRNCNEDDPSCLDVDVLLFNIVSKREMESENVALASLKQLEDADLDRAIIESEQEREAIQARKRQRVNDLRCDSQSKLASADEFKNSILLKPTISRNSNNSEDGVVQSHSLTDNNVGNALSKIVELLDNNTNGCSSSSSSSAILSSGDYSRLREATTNLLLLERDALKFHKEASVPYLRGLGMYLNIALNQSLDDFIANKTAVLNKQISFVNNPAIIHKVLNNQVSRLQTCLYKLPKDGHMVPSLFRRAMDRPSLTVFHSSIEEDGFEVVINKNSSSQPSKSNSYGINSSGNSNSNDRSFSMISLPPLEEEEVSKAAAAAGSLELKEEEWNFLTSLYTDVLTDGDDDDEAPIKDTDSISSDTED